VGVKRLVKPKGFKTAAEKSAFWEGFGKALDLCGFDVAVRCMKCHQENATMSTKCEFCGSLKLKEELYCFTEK
jgi:hypothetical protein